MHSPDRRNTMPTPNSTLCLGHIDEPHRVEDYAEVLSRVATEHQPVIVRREGSDLAAVVPLEMLDLIQEALAQQEAERLAKEIDWEQWVKTHPPDPSWFEGDEPR